jgi:hypothetical protein
VNAAVSLRDIINELEMLTEERTVFLNKRTGELIVLSEEELSAAEEGADLGDFPEWQQELIVKAREVVESDDCLHLPSKFDINDYKIMEDFCYSIQDRTVGDTLLSAIRGSGAFRRFKDKIRSLAIEEEWYRFREKALEAIAIAWLEENQIVYTRDG